MGLVVTLAVASVAGHLTPPREDMSMTEPGQQSEQVRTDVTALRPEPPKFTVWVVLAALAPAVFGVGALLAGARLAGGVLIATGLVGALVLPAMVRVAAARQPNRLEVTRDRITVVGRPGFASEIRRAQGDVLSERSVGPQRNLCVTRSDGLEDGMIALPRFDLGKVREATLAHGWQWQATGTAPQDVTARRPAAPAAELDPALTGETTIALRDGNRRTVQKGAVASVALLVGLVLFLLFKLIASSGLSTGVSVALMFAACLLPAAVLVGGSFLAVRRSRAVIMVGDQRIAVKYGSLSAQVVQRSDIASASVGARWARLRASSGKQLIWVPLRPKRDEVLAALRAHNWPTS
jgi:hypothetical protein